MVTELQVFAVWVNFHITKLYERILAWTQIGTKAEFQIPVTCVCCRYPGFGLLDFRMWDHMEEAV